MNLSIFFNHITNCHATFLILGSSIYLCWCCSSKIIHSHSLRHIILLFLIDGSGIRIQTQVLNTYNSIINCCKSKFSSLPGILKSVVNHWIIIQFLQFRIDCEGNRINSIYSCWDSLINNTFFNYCITSITFQCLKYQKFL